MCTLTSLPWDHHGAIPAKGPRPEKEQGQRSQGRSTHPDSRNSSPRLAYTTHELEPSRALRHMGRRNKRQGRRLLFSESVG